MAIKLYWLLLFKTALTNDDKPQNTLLLATNNFASSKQGILISVCSIVKQFVSQSIKAKQIYIVPLVVCESESGISHHWHTSMHYNKIRNESVWHTDIAVCIKFRAQHIPMQATQPSKKEDEIHSKVWHQPQIQQQASRRTKVQAKQVTCVNPSIKSLNWSSTIIAVTITTDMHHDFVVFILNKCKNRARNHKLHSYDRQNLRCSDRNYWILSLFCTRPSSPLSSSAAFFWIHNVVAFLQWHYKTDYITIMPHHVCFQFWCSIFFPVHQIR